MITSNNLGSISGGTVAIITGTNFQPGAKVLFGETPAAKAEVTENTTIVATTPAHDSGNVSVTVINPDGRRATIADGFRFNSLKPRLTSLTPDHGPLAGGTVVTAQGSGFTASAVKVTVHGKTVLAAPTNDQTLTFVTPASEEAGEVNVNVVSADGTLASDSANYFYE